jgi:phospholipid transport system substrate-binding protein
MTRRVVAIGLLILGVLAVVPPRQAAAQDARSFVHTLGQQAIQVLGPHVPEATRVARFRELFRNDFDLGGIGQFVLGRYWRVATPQEQQEFLALFHEYLVRAYSARLGQYSGEQFQVLGARQSGAETIVSSQILRASGAPVQVDWYLVDGGGRLLITDVYVGGISMKVTQRDEFGHPAQRRAGRRPYCRTSAEVGRRLELRVSSPAGAAAGSSRR